MAIKLFNLSLLECIDYIMDIINNYHKYWRYYENDNAIIITLNVPGICELRLFFSTFQHYIEIMYYKEREMDTLTDKDEIFIDKLKFIRYSYEPDNIVVLTKLQELFIAVEDNTKKAIPSTIWDFLSI